MYRVKLTNFEGPLDLLHKLIESKKLDITEVSLAQVADQFIAYIKNLQEASPKDLADFLVMAGRLALIKSRALLPSLTLTPEEEGDIANLKEQLAEYYELRQITQELHLLDKRRKIFYTREYLQDIRPVFYFPRVLKASKMAAALKNLLETITLPQRIPQAQAIDIISLERKIAALAETLRKRRELSFSETLTSSETGEKVATFLGVLELMKSSGLLAEQKGNFEEIKLKWPASN